MKQISALITRIKTIFATCCILHSCTTHTSLTHHTKKVCQTACQCTKGSRIIVPSLDTYRTDQERKKMVADKIIIGRKVEKSLDQRFKKPSNMSDWQIYKAQEYLQKYMDTKYSNVEDLPGKSSPLQDKINFALPYNRYTQLKNEAIARISKKPSL